MDKSFVDRFELDVGAADARARFVNRVRNEVFSNLLLMRVSSSEQWQIARAVATKLGVEQGGRHTSSIVGTGFLESLAALEAIHASINSTQRPKLSTLIEDLLGMAEKDLGVAWRDGRFFPTGAGMLDDKLVNDPLRWLRESKHESVIAPFEKGLRHLLEAPQRPELASDVVTDMYEALEALAMIVTDRPGKDLSSNRELFLSRVKASDAYKKLMKEYIEYANNFRHAMKQTCKPHVSLREAESFTYLTGLFIRLALPT